VDGLCTAAWGLLHPTTAPKVPRKVGLGFPTGPAHRPGLCTACFTPEHSHCDGNYWARAEFFLL